MAENKLAPCPICGGEMKVDYRLDQDEERGYFVFCDNCELYYGLDEDARDRGYLWGQYNKAGVIRMWNKTVLSHGKE